jgi:beta-fructofuranosidase
MHQEISQATQALKLAIPKAESDPFRPRYHFTAPANWMNDPNGTIYHHGEYHLFYQLNPFTDRWGHIHWGHARSSDLVHWEHLPIALAPQKELGERHCFSGCCVIYKGTPVIFYTKISDFSSATLFTWGAEQSMATGDPGMIKWKKHPRNPILSQAIHGRRKVYNWRDPCIWEQDGVWYMGIAGQLFGELYGSVFLYRSDNLLDWNFVGRLYRGNKTLGRIWECPNYFALEQRNVLIVSPLRQVIYSIGEYQYGRHHGDDWHILDHGKKFYATNTFHDDRGRTILVGWIKVRGRSGWAGCLSLPREIKITAGGRLSSKPIPELQSLRKEKRSFWVSIPSRSTEIIQDQFEPIYGDCLEIKARFNLHRARYAGFKLLDDSGEYLISYNYQRKSFTAVHEKGELDIDQGEAPLDLHIFIDKSVIEIYINDIECFSTVFYPKLNGGRRLKILPFVSASQGDFYIDVWELDEIKFKLPPEMI